jgi:hypothetical protein
MSSSRAPYYVALALSVFAVSEAQAGDGMRCGNKLIGRGDLMYEVESRCGTPNDKQHRVETRTVRSWISTPCQVPGQSNCGQMVERQVEVAIDEWLYDFGPDRLIQHLIFEQGRLAVVNSGSYGIKRD